MASPCCVRPRVEELENRTLFSVSFIKDIQPGGGPYPGVNNNALNVNGTLFFQANDGVHGAELWKSDGTAAGTVLVQDINPGQAGSGLILQYFANVNGTLFFNADDGSKPYNAQLWKSDGTAGGTTMVKLINPDFDALPTQMTNVNGTLFFSAIDTFDNGFGLWKSDGTESGTVLVKDIRSTNQSSYSQLFRGFTNVNGTLFFVTNDGTHGYELWKSDGTAAGTVLLQDINPGPGNSNPRYLVNVNGTLFFQASDPANGEELWKSDGTVAGTVLVKDINAGGGNADPRYLTNMNGTLFFQATTAANGRELWRSDGTPGGTVIVKDINAGGDSFASFLANVNGTLFFNATDGPHGKELWKSDGTAAGTVLVKDINPSGISLPLHLTNVNGKLYFTASDGTNGIELWESDGTAAGTIQDEVRPGATGSYPFYLTNASGTLFFAADDGVHGTALWTVPGPVLKGAAVTNAVFSGAAADTFDTVTLTFSKTVQSATVNAANVTLTGPGGTIPITAIMKVAGSGGTRFTVTFAPQSATGTYTIQTAVGILDANGKPMDQNANAINGQAGLSPIGDEFSASRGLGVDLVPQIVALAQSDGSVKILDGNTGVALSSFRPMDANGNQYKSTVAVALGDLDGDGTDELFVAAQKRAGVLGLDASKAGKVFVYSATSLAAGDGTIQPFDTITPFATPFGGASNPDGTTTYQTGFELATGDVNGDGTVDLIAGSRGDVGQISVMSGVGTGTGHSRLGNVVTPFGTNYRGKVTVAAGNFIAETGTQNDEIAAARGNTDSTDARATGTSTRVAMFDLVGSSLNPVAFSGAISSDGIPSGIQGAGGQVIDRNAFVASINLSGTGADLLLFAARDFESNPNNAQIRVAVYGVSANGAGTVQSANGGSYTVGNQVSSYAIARSDIDGNGADSLALVVDGPSAGVLYLAPLTGANLGGLTTSVLTGGVRITSN